MDRKIDFYKTPTKEKIDESLDGLINNVIEDVTIINIVSYTFLQMYGLKIDQANDTNGWFCDWWGQMTYKDHTINIYGEAFYGNITLTLKETK